MSRKPTVEDSDDRVSKLEEVRRKVKGRVAKTEADRRCKEEEVINDIAITSAWMYRIASINYTQLG